ncbi:PEP-CTERM sorting domain-containing protein [Paucibacter sp. TC2R-5]|uniref:PEP-CTERM sorting domain-containing protein n=1 Tax=Paucibacter sp. TC2R-5 TaxID=2893555 RepID=UPI0021E4089D|nr:PEP-CTERM sorting domain-containing protein [Paucibacter sp. TC2R-5]MCV2358333.1 PEP-CTERM sorting domain-containing protein [Paucibacter sp. TC2R-5]
MNTKLSIALLALAGFSLPAMAGNGNGNGNNNGNSGGSQALQTCGANDLTGGTFLACSGYLSGNLINGSAPDKLATFTALTALGQKAGHAYGGTDIWVEKKDFSGNTIDFTTPLNGLTFLGIHKGGAGEGAQGTAFYLINAGTNLDKLTYNLGGLSNAAIYKTGVSPVPEPETYALMLAGLAAVGFVAKRRKAA